MRRHEIEHIGCSLDEQRDRRRDFVGMTDVYDAPYRGVVAVVSAISLTNAV